MAKQLDAKDGTTDGSISASIWNDFVGKIGTGKTINESISTVRAMNSITAYCCRLGSAESKTGTQKAREWCDEYTDLFTPSSPAPAQQEVTNEEVTNEEVTNQEVTAQEGEKLAPSVPEDLVIPDKHVTPPEENSPVYGPGYLVPDMAYAGQTYTRFDGTKCEYNSEGYIIKDYDNKGNCIREISRDDDGSIDGFADYEYGTNGVTREIRYNSDGDISYFADYEYADGKKTKNTVYYLNDDWEWYVHSVSYYHPNEKDKEYTCYNSDGTLYCHCTYNEKGKPIKREYPNLEHPYYAIYEYGADGETLISIKTFNLDGTPFVE